MTSDQDAAALENLAADGSCRAQAGCETAGEVAAAAHIVAAMVLDIGRIVGVTGPGGLHEVCVVAGARVGIADHDAQRRACCAVLEHAAENLRLVGFLARRRALVAARRTAGHLQKKRVPVNLFPGGQAVDHNADGGAVALAEN